MTQEIDGFTSTFAEDGERYKDDKIDDISETSVSDDSASMKYPTGQKRDRARGGVDEIERKPMLDNSVRERDRSKVNVYAWEDKRLGKTMVVEARKRRAARVILRFMMFSHGFHIYLNRKAAPLKEELVDIERRRVEELKEIERWKIDALERTPVEMEEEANRVQNEWFAAQSSMKEFRNDLKSHAQEISSMKNEGKLLKIENKELEGVFKEIKEKFSRKEDKTKALEIETGKMEAIVKQMSGAISKYQKSMEEIEWNIAMENTLQKIFLDGMRAIIEIIRSRIEIFRHEQKFVACIQDLMKQAVDNRTAALALFGEGSESKNGPKDETNGEKSTRGNDQPSESKNDLLNSVSEEKEDIIIEEDDFRVLRDPKRHSQGERSKQRPRNTGSRRASEMSQSERQKSLSLFMGTSALLSLVEDGKDGKITKKKKGRRSQSVRGALSYSDSRKLSKDSIMSRSMVPGNWDLSQQPTKKDGIKKSKRKARKSESLFMDLVNEIGGDDA